MKILHFAFSWLVLVCFVSDNQIKAVSCVEPAIGLSASLVLCPANRLQEFKQYNDGLIQADLKAAEISNWTDLHLAALWGLADEVACLIDEQMFSINLQSTVDEQDKKKQIELIVNVQDKNGQTPLHLAAARGKVKCIDVLLAHDADPNAQDKHGWTPLHVAYFHMHSLYHLSISTLKNAGASTEVKNSRRQTPLEVRSETDKHSWR